MKVMRPKKYEGQNVDGALISEKLHGVRAISTGKGQLISKNGNEFRVPEWFLDQLPIGIRLEGELYAGIGNFEKVLSCVLKKEPIDSEWKEMKFHIFDAPEHGATYEERLKYCRRILFFPNLFRKFQMIRNVSVVIKATVCFGDWHREAFFESIIKKGGEGIILAHPFGMYAAGPSDSVLKQKAVEDAEAVVIGYTDGKGEFEGCVGALVCKYKGKEFKVSAGLTHSMRIRPPKINSVITFSFETISKKGIPANVKFISERNYE